MDQISDSEGVYWHGTPAGASATGWWQKSSSVTYPKDNDATPLIASVSYQRITGLGTAAPAPFTGILTSESISQDIHGNINSSCTFTDSINKTVYRVSDTPSSTTDAVSKSVNGLTVSTTDTTGSTRYYLYDSLGRQIGSTDPRISSYDEVTATWTNINRTQYNSLGQVEWTEDTAGIRTTYAYDQSTGRRTLVTDSLGKKTYTAYTLRGQVRRTWGDVPYPVEYAYDVFGRMIELHTFRGGSGWNGSTWPVDLGTADVTYWNYQGSTGLLEQKIYADGNGPLYTYYDSGGLATRTWVRLNGSGQPVSTTYTYDSATGALVHTDYSDTTPDISYTYTRTGQQATVTDAAGIRSFTYNPAMQLESETLPTGFYDDRVLTRKYEAVPQINALPGRDAGYLLGTAADPDAYADVTYAYGTDGRFTSVTGHNSGTFTYEYIAGSGLFGTVTYPGGISVSKIYEAHRNVIDAVENKVGATVVSRYDYTNDSVGRRTHVVTTGTAFVQNTFNHYAYNDRSEVTGGQKYHGTDINDMTNPVTGYDYDYAYDPIGNRLSYSDSGSTATYTSNQLNQYTAINSLSDPQYDADGNMTLMPSDSGDWTLTWNGENRLIAAESANTKLEYSYDYMGRRVQKKVYGWDTDHWLLTTDNRFVYDAWNLIAELDALNSNTFVKSYLWGLDLSQSLQGAGGVGGLLAVTEHNPAGNDTYYATYDANGNVSEYLDAAGVMSAHYEYSPFGKLTAATGAKAAAFAHRFSTKYLDSQTGLYYYGFRSYSPSLGRWLNRDPIGESGGLNLYGFVGNRIPYLIDALGLSRLKLNLNPSSAFGINFSYKPFPANAGGYTGGTTELLDPSLTCKCDANCEMDCEFKATFKVFLNDDFINTPEKTIYVAPIGPVADPTPVPVVWTKTGVYGHEQKHVYSYIDEFTSLAEDPNLFPLPEQPCRGEDLPTKMKHIGDLIKAIITKENSHLNPGSPQWQSLYDPILPDSVTDIDDLFIEE